MKKTTLYVKKIWSFHPNLYKYVPYNTALKAYDDYLQYFRLSDREPTDFKSFQEWLDTEIQI